MVTSSFKIWINKRASHYIPPATQPYVFQWPPQHKWGIGPQVNNFEQVSTNCHQMSVVPGVGTQVLCGGEGTGVLYHMTYPMILCYLPSPSREQTDACKNITYPKLLLWGGGVKMHLSLTQQQSNSIGHRQSRNVKGDGHVTVVRLNHYLK